MDAYARNHSPLISLLCPPPINVILTANTFVRFLHDNQVNVGLVLSVNPMEQLLCIRLFLSWVDVVHRVGALNLPQNVRFWPNNSRHPPYYICDTDIILKNIPSSNVVGLAFVFYDTSPTIREVLGMKNTYRVSSCVWFAQGVIKHCATFKSYPLERFPDVLLWCFPSMIMSQLLTVKHELEKLMNTRSLRSRNTTSVQIQNIDLSTWAYMIYNAPVEIQTNTVVSRAGHVHFNDFIQQSWREMQFSLWLGMSDHLDFVQKLFGLNFGVGVRFAVSCRLPRTEQKIEVSREMDTNDTLNIIPFEDNHTELVGRGLYIKFKPRTKVLSITLRYRRLVGEAQFLTHLEARGMVHVNDEEEGEIYPFYRDTVVDGCSIEQYNINTRMVRLSDNRHLSVNEVIDLLNLGI